MTKRVSDAELISIYNDTKQFPYRQDVWNHFKGRIQPRTVDNRIAKLRKSETNKVISRSSSKTRSEFVRARNKSRIDILDERIRKYEGVRDTRAEFYLITTALESSPVFSAGFKSMLLYRDHINHNFGKCSIIVLPAKYSYSKNTEIEGWDSQLEEYLVSGRRIIHDRLEIAADVDILATATIPVNGWANLTGKRSTIIPHPRLQEKMIAGLGNTQKMIQTTGAITQSNYTRSRAGAGGRHHHSYGFVIAEVAGSVYHTRQVSICDDGSFDDLNVNVSSLGVKESTDAVAVFGDIHAAQSDKRALTAAVDVANRLNVKTIMTHDVFDGEGINPHESKNPFNAKPVELNISSEINGAVDLLLRIREDTNAKVTVVASNHDDFLDRYLLQNDWRTIRYENREMYLIEALETLRGNRSKGSFAYYAERAGFPCLALGESYRPNKFELGIHGHKGVSGSRGSPTQFATQLVEKVISGHTHQRFRRDGVLNPGCLCKLKPGYVMKSGDIGAWTHGVSVEYLSGKATNIEIKRGQYTNMP